RLFLRLFAKKMECSTMQLELAGWDKSWAEAFEKYRHAGLLPGRVFTYNRQVYSVYTEAGEVTAEVAGSLLYRADDCDLPVVGDWVGCRQHAPGNLTII